MTFRPRGLHPRHRVNPPAAAFLLAGLVVWGCGEPAAAPEAPADAAADYLELAEEVQAQAGIETTPVKAVRRIDTVEAPGVVALDEARTARVGSVVDGVVTHTAVEVGSHVRRGQRLAELHSHVIHDAWAAYRTSVADERRLTTELAYAEEAEARARRLFDAKAISEQQLRRAEADTIAAREQLDMAGTEVQRSIDELDHYGMDAADAGRAEAIPVRSPVTGVVLERLVTEGTAVTIGTPLFLVSDLASLWVVAEIDETELGRVTVDRPVSVRVAAYPDETFDGTITYIGETVNPRTRRVTVRSSVPNPDGRLKPAMYATAALGEGDPREVLQVPSEAIQEIDGQSVVFVKDAPMRFRPRVVELGPEVDGWVEVRTGVADGEAVVSAGAFLIKSELLKATIDEGD